ncbi:hypothetical protein CPB86DRAFT_775266 [Serendipita vermifera]|nr:hypothetical protein CPB86DRAFT_775266 [Serendipita vermifera]
MTRLSDSYENAYTDFHGSGTPCIYKTGPAWPKRTGHQAQKLYRAARPIHNHSIRPVWLSIAWSIVAKLDTLQVDWNAINPLAYADAGVATLICDFVITIAVKPGSLLYAAAVTAANAIDKILQDAGFPEIQVTFIESVLHRSGAGPKPLSFNPLLDPVPELRKAFSYSLGGLFFRLSKDEKRVALLTCAHVARPPPLFDNTTITRKNNSQAREDIVLLGTEAFQAAVQAMVEFIDYQAFCISTWERQLKKLGEAKEGEADNVSDRREELMGLIKRANKKIKDADQLYREVTKYRSTVAERVIGFVLHCEKIKVAVGSHKFTEDWSFIEMDEDMIDCANFIGNKLYVDQGFVPEPEFHDPQDLDINDVKTLLCVKNARSTGTTFGRVNGLESITRHYKDHGIHEDSMEYAVLGYDTSSLENTKFSASGDSGATVVGRDGRIIGILTGGGGPTDGTDITYITPYFWLETRIKDKFPNCFLYPIDE